MDKNKVKVKVEDAFKDKAGIGSEGRTGNKVDQRLGLGKPYVF